MAVLRLKMEMQSCGEESVQGIGTISVAEFDLYSRIKFFIIKIFFSYLNYQNGTVIHAS